MVVATGTSSRHAVSVADKLIFDLKNEDIVGVEAEGKELGEWVLVDIWDVIVHVFQPEARERYKIEQMWEMPGEKAERKKPVKKTAEKEPTKKAPAKKPAAKKK